MNNLVEPVPGELTRFYVQSESDPNTRHMVDLAFNGGSGFCDCQAFSFRCEKNIKAGKPLFSMGEPIVNPKGGISYPDQTICKHLRRVQEYLLPTLLKRLAEFNGRRSSAGSSALRRNPTASQDACRAPEANATRGQSSQSKTAETSKDSLPAWLQ